MRCGQGYAPLMMTRTVLALFLALGGGCALDLSADDQTSSDESAVDSSNLYVHLDVTNGLGAATISVVNGYKVRCPDGHSASTCQVAALTVPASCGFECQDGLLGGQGESIVRGGFVGTAFAIAAGHDAWQRGLGTYSVYRITAEPTCTQDPCPAGLRAQKLNTKATATAINGVDFAHANDPNFVLDPTRGDDEITASAGLLVSGHIVSHVFRADRVWRIETPVAACDPQNVARAHAFLGSASDVVQFRTVAVAERSPRTEPDTSLAWLVRTAETEATVEFTAGLDDLWDEKFQVRKSDCAVTTTAEH